MKPLLPFLALLAICFLIVVSYLPVFFSDFVNWDDEAHFLQNPFVQHLDAQGIGEIFSTLVCGVYIPLTTFSFAVEHAFFGWDPGVMHTTNLALHLMVTCLVFVLGCQCRFPPVVSFLAALLFGLHPLHVESVAWVTERKDVLYGVFYMLSLVTYCRYLRERMSVPVPERSYADDNPGAFCFLMLAFVFGFLSVLAKPMALSLPLVWLLLDWMQHRRWSFSVLLEKAALALVLIPVVWETYRHQARVLHWEWPGSLLTAVWTLTFYLRKFFCPVDLTVFYRKPAPFTFAQPDVVIACAVLICTAAAVFVLRRQRVVVFAVLFYLASIFFLVRWDTAGEGHLVADRYMYLPSIGFCFLFGSVWVWLSARYARVFLPVVFLGAVLIVTLLMSQTFSQCLVWSDSTSLWEHQVEADPFPAAALVRVKLAEAYLTEDYQRTAVWEVPFWNMGPLSPGRTKRIEALLAEAVSIKPDFSEAYLVGAKLWMRNRNPDRAEQKLRKAIEYDPGNFEALFQLGELSRIASERGAALAFYRRALDCVPGNRMLAARINRSLEGEAAWEAGL